MWTPGSHTIGSEIRTRGMEFVKAKARESTPVPRDIDLLVGNPLIGWSSLLVSFDTCFAVAS